MPVPFFLYCFEGVLTQEKLFVPYIFWSVSYYRQQPETHGSAAFAASACPDGILSGKCAAHGIVIFDTGTV